MDNNEYISKQKVEKWTTKEKFKDFQLLGIEPGTEYNLTGAIEEGELDSALQTKINGKLTAPTTPTAESAVTMLADGTVGTKPLSEIGGGGKLYLHEVAVFFEYNSATASVVLNNIYNTSNIHLVTKQLLNPYINNDCGIGCTSKINTPDGTPTSTGTILIDDGLAIIVLVGNISNDSTVGMINGVFALSNIQDTVTEL